MSIYYHSKNNDNNDGNNDDNKDENIVTLKGIIDKVINFIDIPINNMFVTNLDGYNEFLPDGLTGVGSPDEVIREGIDKNIDLNFQEVAENDLFSYDHVFVIANNHINTGAAVFQFGSNNKVTVSPTRLIFHELMHTQFDWKPRDLNYPNEGVRFEEELAIFAENTIYARAASYMGETDGNVIRYGHLTSGASGGSYGVSGVNSFAQYSHISISDKSPESASFEASQNGYNIKKTYHNYDHTIGGQKYDHYIKLEEEYINTYISIDKSNFAINNRIFTLAGDMMGSSGLNVKINAAVTATQSGLNIFSDQNMEIHRTIGLGNDSYRASDKSNSVFEFKGVAAAGTDDKPLIISINDSNSNISSLIIGAGSVTSYDNIIAGSGDDMLIATGFGASLQGGDGNDVLFGTSGEDDLIGGNDNDIIIGTAGSDYVDGGDGIDILTFSNSNSAIHIDMRSGSGLLGDALGDDIISIESIIGTSHNDVFTANGTGMTFYGSKSAVTNPSTYFATGDDTFIAAQGADKFIADPHYQTTRNTLDFSKITGGINMTVNLDQSGFTQLGHEFMGISKFIGTSDNDFFSMDSTAKTTLETGAGEDTVVARSGNVNLGSGDDYIFVKNAFGHKIDGGSGFDTLDFSSFTPPSSNYSLGVTVNLSNSYFWQHGTPSYQSSTFSNIEDFKFGDVNASIAGSNSSDVIICDASSAIINGLDGADYITIAPSEFSGSVKVNGNSGDDVITSTRAGEFFGGSGNDQINGSDFSDTIRGEDGNDILYGNNGNDFFYYGFGIDYINGGNDIDNFLMYYGLKDFSFSVDEGNIKIQRVNNQNISTLENVEIITYDRSGPGYGYIKAIDIISIIDSLGPISGSDLERELNKRRQIYERAPEVEPISKSYVETGNGRRPFDIDDNIIDYNYPNESYSKISMIHESDYFMA